MASFAVATTQPLVVDAAPVSYKGEKYARIYKNLGITQIILGSISIIFAIVTIGLSSTSIYNSLTYVASGIWCGLLVLVAGILGVVSGRKPMRCPITGALVMTIFAAIASFLMLSNEVMATIQSAAFINNPTLTYPSNNLYSNTDPGIQKALTAFHAMLCIIAFIQFVIAIVHSAYCCAVNCCGSTTGAVMTSQNTMVTTTTTTTAPPGQIPVAIIPGQPIQNGLTPTQYVIQGQPGVMPQAGYQPVPQAAYQNLAFVDATQPMPEKIHPMYEDPLPLKNVQE